MLKIYMIGSMTGLSYEVANKPRKEFSKKIESHGFKCLNPCTGWDYNKFYKYTTKEVVAHNDMFLHKSDMGVVFNTAPLNALTSPGTIQECAYYRYNPFKPLFGIGKLEKEQPHILESVVKWFNTDDELIEYLVTIYGQLL